MCGIFGYFCNSEVNMQSVLELLKILEKDQLKGEKTPVGGHGAGVCFLDDFGKFVVYKIGKTNSSPAEDLSSIRDVVQVKSRIILAHVRHASPEFMDTIKYAEATQPYNVNCLGLSEVVSAHNGKVRNYEEIRKNLSPHHSFESEVVKLVDSEVIPHLFEENLKMCCDEFEARERTLEFLKGNNAVVLLSSIGENRFLHILHKGHSRGMHLWKNGKGEVILCSRSEPLQQVFGGFLQEGNFKKTLSIRWQVDEEVQQTHEIV